MAEIKENRWHSNRYGHYAYYLFKYKPAYKSFGEVYVGYMYKDYARRGVLYFEVMWSGSYDLPEPVDDEMNQELNIETKVEDIDHYKYLNRFTKDIIRSIFDNIDVSELFHGAKIQIKKTVKKATDG